MGRTTLFVGAAYVALGVLAFFVLGRSRTLTCRQEPPVCEVRERGWVEETNEVVRRDQVVGVEVEQSLGKCRTKMRTRRREILLAPNWTVKCISQRKTADEINAFLGSPREPPLVVRFEERLMFYTYTTSYLVGALLVVLATFWPARLLIRVDRRRGLVSYREVGRPWRGAKRVVPIGSVKAILFEGKEDGVRVELSLDDDKSAVVRTEVVVEEASIELARDRIAAVLAECRERRDRDADSLPGR